MKEQRRQFVMSFIAYAVQRNIDAKALCDEAGIDLEHLTQHKEADIKEVAVQRLWMAAEKLTNDPLFGLHFGESLQLAALGVVGEIIKSSDTVGNALAVASTFTPVVTTLYTMRIEKEGKQVAVIFEPTREEPIEIARHIADFLMVFTIQELGGLLLKKICPRSIEYPFKISQQKEYERVFACAPETRHNVLKIFFDAAGMDEPIITANYEVQRFFLDTFSSTPAEPSVSFQAKVMDFLLKNAYRGLPSLEDVAANFNITPRSFQRRLQDEGTTFQQTLDTVRKTLAVHYLESGNYKVKEISNLLGYNELSAFSRAFKRWTGKAPMSYSA